MALFCIISEIKRDVGRKSRFFHARPAFDAPVRGGPRHNIAITFGLGILEWRGYPTIKKRLIIRLDASTQYRRVMDRRKNVQTGILHSIAQ